MTLQFIPTNPLACYWGHATPRTPAATPRETCTVCRYELIDGWCSRCDLEENGILL